MKGFALQNIHKSEPLDVLATVNDCSNLIRIPDDVARWDVNAQFAATNAYFCSTAGDTSGSYQWSQVAVEIYRRLKNEDVLNRLRHEESEMRCRANAIVVCGPNESDELLNPEVVQEWFFQSAPCSPAEVRRMADPFEATVDDDFDVEKFDVLRALKANVRIINGMAKKKVFSKLDEINSFVELQSVLP